MNKKRYTRLKVKMLLLVVAGTLMVTAIKQRNGPVVQGSVLFTAVVFSFINLAVDILYSFVDPRIRSQYKSKPKADKVPKAVKAGKAGEVSE